MVGTFCSNALSRTISRGRVFLLPPEHLMSRELTSHKVNGLNDAIQIKVLDDPGPGGASHRYKIGIPLLDPVEAHVEENSQRIRSHLAIHFQEGPITEAGFNGISMEALLAVVEDRLKGFQSGQYACRENALALTHLQEAMHWLHHRTRERIARGVEGTSEK